MHEKLEKRWTEEKDLIVRYQPLKEEVIQVQKELDDALAKATKTQINADFVLAGDLLKRHNAKKKELESVEQQAHAARSLRAGAEGSRKPRSRRPRTSPRSSSR